MSSFVKNLVSSSSGAPRIKEIFPNKVIAISRFFLCQSKLISLKSLGFSGHRISDSKTSLLLVATRSNISFQSLLFLVSSLSK